MKNFFRLALTLAAVVIFVAGFALTRDGTLITPKGQGVVSLAGGDFEAFPLPAYAAKMLDDDYKSYLVEVAPGIKIHVLEVGNGFPVYMQSGIPVSGFLYRKVADNLPRDQFRVIMPTLIGLGFSSKIPASQHTLENHLNWMNTLLGELALSELIFVGHDWGGPIGAGALERSPDLMKGAVILNTVLDAPRQPRPVPMILQMARTPVIGEFMLEGFISIFDQLPGYQNDPDSLPRDVLNVYSRPLDDSGNSKAPLALARMSVFDPDHPDTEKLLKTEIYLRSRDIPMEIVWGINDPRLGDRLTDMKNLFPNAAVVETDAGHFLQEEVPKDVASAVKRIFDRIQR